MTAEQAIKKDRKFAFVSDIVCDQAYESLAVESRGLTRLKLRVKARLIRAWQRRLIARCELMHCNGMDTYQAYASLCRSPDIAIKFHGLEIGPEQLMPPDLVEAKWRDAASRRDLRVCYAGRVEPRKPRSTGCAIGETRRLGTDIKAVWMGDGSIFPAMQAEVERLGLSGIIELTGFVSDRDQVIRRIRESDVMLFTHIELESPRVLIEALMSACPIVGYERLHPANLISVHGGGELTPLGDWQAAGAALARLVADRDHLAELIQRAYRDGVRFDSEVIVRDRCAAIRERLS